jgi:cytochrome c oxidase subunit 2
MAPNSGRPRRRWALVSGLLVIGVPTIARADAPMTYLVGYGTRNYGVATLLWALLVVSLLVVVIVTVLLIAGMARRRGAPRLHNPRDVPVTRPATGLAWIYVGTAISAVVLVASAIWTFATLAAVSIPPKNTKLKIHVTSHQWWWEIRYDDNDVSRIFTTANEIHIPTGEPVKIELTSVDVLHSFWVPQLTGKTDLIPGQQNVTWLEADKPGTYRGQCAEYCGLQHAHMVMSVIAQPAPQFDAWWRDQLEAAPIPQSKKIANGQTNFVAHCGLCHAVRGTQAGGVLGPDLSHLISRQTLGAGTLPNTPGYLVGWVADPQHAKPGNLMPILNLTGTQLTDIEAYLETLK